MQGRSAPAANNVVPIAPAFGAAAMAAAAGSGFSSEATSNLASTVSVVTFNMQHRDRPQELAVMAEYLEAIDRQPDFILCQEVLFERHAHRGRADTATVLADELGSYSRGAKRESDREGVAIISRYPFDRYEELHLKTRTSAMLFGFKRVSVMGEFLVPKLGRVRVVGVHLAYHGFEHRVRRKQLTETLAWIADRERRVPADLTILGGDFNMTPDRKEWAVMADPAIVRDLDFIDANTDEPTHGPRGNPSRRLDYIFIAAPNGHVRLLEEELLFDDGLSWKDGSERFWISDHVPVYQEYAVYRDAQAAAP